MTAIVNFNDFVTALLVAGFSMGGDNDEGIFSVSQYYDSRIQYHTGNIETDPWEWRMRVLEERDDVAYAKIFFRKSGFITKEWYPCFMAVRRGKMSLEEEYSKGTLSRDAKRIYDIIRESSSLPLHTIKQHEGFGKADRSKFEHALVELQMKMYITMCGRQQKVSRTGVEYGWSSTVFQATESFFGKDVFNKAAHISEQEAIENITQQIHHLNPTADEKKIMKFIKGSL
jgi:hypothetical protein